ncbi:MAG: aquaporin [Dehalococcoidia bacterium]|nr:aquaporin [Dehalococcoidia bacterium]
MHIHPQDFVLTPERSRELIVEFLGVFALCFIGIGAIVATQGGDLVAIALAHGLVIGLMVAAAGHISGGAFNPAVTVGLLVANRITVGKAISYIVVQVAGGVVGALAVKAAFPDASTDAVGLGVPQILDDLRWGSAFIGELIMTFLLMFVIFGVAVDSHGPRGIAGLAIGLAITMDIFAGGALTGAAMNPARAFGPALVQNIWDDQWLYWVACPLGAILAAALYQYVLIPGGETLPDKLAEGDIHDSSGRRVTTHEAHVATRVEQEIEHEIVAMESEIQRGEAEDDRNDPVARG